VSEGPDLPQLSAKKRKVAKMSIKISLFIIIMLTP
jgi:hypothetical protein